MPEPLAEIELPILREIGQALYAAAMALDERDGILALDGRSSVSRRRSSSRARRRHGLQWPTLMVVALCASALTLGGLALAGVLGAGVGITPQQWLSGLRAKPPTAITPEQSAHLTILRRPRVASQDAISADDAALLSHGTFRYAAGADFALSRRVRGLPAGAAWIVPGAGRICLMAYSKVDAGGRLSKGEPGGVLCEPNAPVVRGRLVLFARDSKAAGMGLLAGVVPDGVSTVLVGLAGGGQIQLAVHENVYLAYVRGSIASASFAGPYGRMSLGPFSGPPLRRASCARRGVDETCAAGGR